MVKELIVMNNHIFYIKHSELSSTFTSTTSQISAMENILLPRYVHLMKQALRVPEPPAQSTVTGLSSATKQTFLATLNTCQNGDPHIQQ